MDNQKLYIIVKKFPRNPNVEFKTFESPQEVIEYIALTQRNTKDDTPSVIHIRSMDEFGNVVNYDVTFRQGRLYLEAEQNISIEGDTKHGKIFR